MVDMGEDTDGTRTAPGGHLDCGKCLAYRCFRGRRCRYDRRQRGSGDHASEQRVLRAPAIGHCVAKRVGRGLRHTVGNAGAHNGTAHHAAAHHAAAHHGTAHHAAAHDAAAHHGTAYHAAAHHAAAHHARAD